MSRWILSLGLCCVLGGLLLAKEDAASSKKVLAYKMKSLSGKDVDLSQYQGKVVVIVNVASRCGLTPQYEDLQGLYEKYKGKGLIVLGFPCNQFGKQEPGSADDIAKFCKDNYSVTFDMFDKVEVNGDGACELYKKLTSLDVPPKGTGKIGWNFEKFLIGRTGEVVGRFEPRTSPTSADFVSAIEKELAAK